MAIKISRGAAVRPALLPRLRRRTLFGMAARSYVDVSAEGFKGAKLVMAGLVVERKQDFRTGRISSRHEGAASAPRGQKEKNGSFCQTASRRLLGAGNKAWNTRIGGA